MSRYLGGSLVSFTPLTSTFQTGTVSTFKGETAAVYIYSLTCSYTGLRGVRLERTTRCPPAFSPSNLLLNPAGSCSLTIFLANKAR